MVIFLPINSKCGFAAAYPPIILVKPGQGLGVGTPPAASSSNNVIGGTKVNHDGGEITVPLGN